MKKETRLARLNELKYMLINHDKLFRTVKFNICVFGEEKSDAPDDGIADKSCMTAACAIGSAALHEPFKKAGLTYPLDNYGPKYKDEEDSFLAGAKFFGITPTESFWLFDPKYYTNKQRKPISPKKITPDIVAARVQILVGHYLDFTEEGLFGEKVAKSYSDYDIYHDAIMSEEELPIRYLAYPMYGCIG